MAEYSLPQALDLAQLSMDGLSSDLDDGGVRARNCLYLAHISMEIALKASLEQAGMAVKKISSMNHDLLALSKTLGNYSFEYALGRERLAVIRDIAVTNDDGRLSFGHFVEATKWDAFSKYPNQLRYGPNVFHFDPKAVARLAAELCKWLQARVHTFRLTAS